MALAIAMLTPLAKNGNIRAVKLLAKNSPDKSKYYEEKFRKSGGDLKFQAQAEFEKAEELWAHGAKTVAFKYYLSAAELIDAHGNNITEMEKVIYRQGFMSETDNPYDLYRGVVAYLYETGKAGIKDAQKAKYWKSKLNANTVIHSNVFDGGCYVSE